MDKYWDILLAIKNKVDNANGDIDFCAVGQDGTIYNNEIPNNKINEIVLFVQLNNRDYNIPKHIPLFRLSNIIHIEQLNSGHLNTTEQLFFQKYLPFCFLSLLAQRNKRTISIAHFAQTLDGKIATNSGHSKWIGNKENLKHAHRMRALCDGILIGKNTLKHDGPKLTVRLVNGKNPARIVLGAGCDKYKSLLESGDGKILVIGDRPTAINDKINSIILKKENGIIPPAIILEKLYQKGINSVYIEGGASTTSCFINQKAVGYITIAYCPHFIRFW